ncbi:MAG: type I-B CRISPR-associated endonuclease Cas1b [Brevinematia bacterium]
MPRSYYIFSSGRVKRKENTIYIETKEGEKKSIPVEDVDDLYFFGEIDLNSRLLNFLSQHNKVIHFYNHYGFYFGSFVPRNRNVSGDLVVKQVQHYVEPDKRLYLAYCFIESGLFHMIWNLKEYEDTLEFQEKIKTELERASKAKSVAEVMGCEGRAREAYYKSFNVITKEKFLMDKREKRPPTNPLNALISFANSMVYTAVLSEIYRTQLNPTISYLHEPRENRYSLSLDISEIFKPIIGDTIIFKLINNNVIKIDDFDKDIGYCYLNEEGRKKFVKAFDEKIRSTIKHKKLKRKVSYKSLIRLECYKIIKHLIGDNVYKPLKAWW